MKFRIFHNISILIALVLAPVPVLKASSPPPPPQDAHIIDNVLLLSAVQARSLSQLLNDFESDTGISLIVVTGIEPEAEVKELLEESGSPTLVASCSMGGGHLSISANTDLLEMIPHTELATVADSANRSAGMASDPGDRLVETITNISTELAAKVEAMEANSKSAWLALVPLAGFVGMALFGIFSSTWVWSRWNSRKSSKEELVFSPDSNC